VAWHRKFKRCVVPLLRRGYGQISEPGFQCYLPAWFVGLSGGPDIFCDQRVLHIGGCVLRFAQGQQLDILYKSTIFADLSSVLVFSNPSLHVWTAC